jgi:quercetin dioxygenase-like cupin family protein
MLTVQTQKLELTHYRSDEDDTRRIDADWPIHRDRGTTSTAVVYFELAPGKRLGTHRDSAEEVLVVLEGEVEAVVGDQRRRLAAGGMAVVPAMASHDVLCAGDVPAKVAGVFPSNTVVSVFEGGFAPEGTRVVGSPMPVLTESDDEEKVVAAGS